MTFLWANIEFEYNSITMRYINDWIWYHYSILAIFPLWIIGLYRIYLHIFDYQKHLQIKQQKFMNAIVFTLTIYAPFYYLFDAIISIYEGTYLTECRFPYFFHHMIAIVVQPFLLSRYVLNWWDIMVCSTHAIFVKYPRNAIIPYIYVSSIFIFNLSLYVDRSSWNNRFVGKYFPVIYYSFFVIFITKDCDSSLPYLAE
ncbi:unnamed protein product [Paramecium primaurelia]|uniref:Uncharacterized protein n=2 Tax=Paramecium TaxID=5884 RepID=A0A8S1WN41_9CILI|nr:unnamed protein product [Paramecium primaurelia]CAD8191414.1 unnamed protein product [Paramecium pentaurelia]